MTPPYICTLVKEKILGEYIYIYIYIYNIYIWCIYIYVCVCVYIYIDTDDESEKCNEIWIKVENSIKKSFIANLWAIKICETYNKIL